MHAEVKHLRLKPHGCAVPGLMRILLGLVSDTEGWGQVAS